MELAVTIPDARVADLQSFVTKRFAILYPAWDTTGVDVLQTMLDDYVADQCCEAQISVQRWAVAEATTEAELTAAQAAESDARDCKIALEVARAAARV